MLNFNLLLESSTTGNGGGMWGTVIMIGLLFVFLYFFMIRPQKKQERKDAEMRDSLSVGDEVTTIGGIIGKVISIKGETFVLETTREKTQIRFLKGAIRTIDVKVAEVAAAVAEAKESEASAEAEAPADKDASAK
jgi:preprotein translocase subunit YajC